MIEFTDKELTLLYEAGIIIADTREELVSKVYEDDDLDLYNDRLLEEIEGTKEYEKIKNQSFVDWFLSKRDCYFEYDNIYFTTPFNYMYSQEDFESIIKKVYEYKKINNDNDEFFRIINKIVGEEIAY
ncbi:hypothetical protein [uncultured Fusobacterium sp.]|jgi:hypothetical protein|uniref:hypothetical protein n=1 Tax=uncultured Fusobacterium sp. TaxID=159267 RepID=UPI00265F5578|nr:hypothetical protein [uncultured Fusobacterium sp.]